MNKSNSSKYLNCCRCCLSKFTKTSKKFEISSIIIEQFFQLTQIQISPITEKHSKHICKTCKKNLQEFNDLRHDYIIKQQQLNENDNSEIILQEIKIKIEPIDPNLLEDNNDDNHFDDDLNWQEDIKAEEESYDEDHENNESEILKNVNNETEALKEDEIPEIPFEFRLKPKQKRKIARNFKCKICSVSHATQKTLENHIMYNHSNTLSRDEILRIKKRNREDRMRICPMCGIKVDQLNRHIKKEHLNIKRYFCDHCPYSSFKRFDISSHVLKHRKKPKKEFMCDICGTEFLRKCSMRQHVRDFHSNKDPFICTICNQKFKTMTLMKKHQKWRHEGGHKVKCPDCDKELAKFCLEKHIMRDPETFDQQFICMECGKEFKNKRCLAYHKQSHNKRDFICEYPDCGKNYATFSQLSTHQKRHTNEKNLKCPYEGCEKAYFKQQNLRIHIASMHAMYRRKCPVKECEYTTGSYNYMRDHLLRHKELKIEEQRELFVAIKHMNLVS
ncbi:hypothetical protein PVAND_006928 [Polypedilum vanderplanki]|uniref:Zinc finger protein n=1 Tax=Polypedilum vanderplanki TaxID=319348 RepID=A0A9J6C551_POLVA|nr:hypothetical protein PVAND_006928 [Polypedilum vanderplanki]